MKRIKRTEMDKLDVRPYWDMHPVEVVRAMRDNVPELLRWLGPSGALVRGRLTVNQLAVPGLPVKWVEVCDGDWVVKYPDGIFAAYPPEAVAFLKPRLNA
jgi:hypothetical protein